MYRPDENTIGMCPKFVVILINVCLCLGSVSPAHGEPLRDIEDLLADNPEAIEVFDYISQVGARLQEDQENHAYYEALALAYEYLSIFEKAREAQLLALRYYPADGKARDVLLGNVARIYFHLNKLPEAKEALDQAAVINPDNITNINYQLYYYMKTREYARAAEIMQRLQKNDPVGDVYYNFYLRAVDQGISAAEVIQFLRTGVELSPDNALALRTLAVALRNDDYSQGKGEFPEAIRMLEQSFRINPKYAATCISLADTYLMMAGRADRSTRRRDARLAQGWANKAKKLEPKNPRVDFVLGQILMVKEDFDGALAQFELLYNRGALKDAVASQMARAYERKAYARYIRGRHLRAALSWAEEALRLDERNAAALRTKAGILLKLKDYEAARLAAQEGLLLQPDDTAVAAELEKIKAAAESGAH